MKEKKEKIVEETKLLRKEKKIQKLWIINIMKKNLRKKCRYNVFYVNVLQEKKSYYVDYANLFIALITEKNEEKLLYQI